ncbi:MAG: hypothetical protein ACXV4A_06180 [Actinomycetes bacterium]
MRACTQTIRLLRAAGTWHVTSVEVARRNALVASTALAQTRAERREVEEFLLAHQAGWESRRAMSAVSRPA